MTGEESLLLGFPDVWWAVLPQYLLAKQFQALQLPCLQLSLLQVAIPMSEEVQEVGTGEVVTAIKVLLPENKRSGEGRKAYESKRQQVMGSFTHLIEIDLLQGGQPMPILNKGIQATYRILVSQSNYRPKVELYPFGLQEPIDRFKLPLRDGDTEPLTDLQALRLRGIQPTEQGLIWRSTIAALQYLSYRNPMQPGQKLCCNSKDSAN